MTSNDSVLMPTGAIVAEAELTINAPRQVVWDAFFKDAHEWWRKDFYTSKTPAKFVIDDKIGGNMYEDTGDGTGLIWFTILGIVPLELVYVIGYSRPPFGGPASGLITFTFEEKGENETIFKISDATHGHVTEKSVAGAETGWTMIFTELKNFVEKK
jgi:uncharacterized protein YndB with AHSA1/START domain